MPSLVALLPYGRVNCALLYSVEGVIPSSIGALASLRAVHLNHNQLTGAFPYFCFFCVSGVGQLKASYYNNMNFVACGFIYRLASPYWLLSSTALAPILHYD